MPKVIAAVAATSAVAVGIWYLLGAPMSQTKAPVANASATTQLAWVAAAPGRVEPKSGEIRLGAAAPGRVAQVLVAVNDKVEENEVLIRIDDQEARGRLAAAEAEAGARRQERDAQPMVAGREDIRRAEDAFFAAERAVMGARFELDNALSAKRTNTPGADQLLSDARKRHSDARDRLQRERLAVASAQARSNLPQPNRFESALSVARTEVAIAEAVLDRTRVRSSIDGTALQVYAKPGELVAPSPDQPLIVLGDISVMRVKAEVDDADVSKIKVGNKAIVRSSSYPGREFEGKIVSTAPSLTTPRIGQRGPRRPTDVEVLEVTVDLEGTTPLLPGMRADVFFRRNQ